MYKVSTILSREEAERLSDLLAELDPSPAAAVAIEEQSKSVWRLDAFCIDADLAADTTRAIEEASPDARISAVALEDKDWVALSLEGLPAVEAGRFFVAGAHELKRAGPGRIPIWIEAGAAFGTGHHGTTKGCLLALDALIKRRPVRRVLDIGCGSGVLAIAAARAGARICLATDIDSQSVYVAKENTRNNRVRRQVVCMRANGARRALIRDMAPYDLVMANILARPLVTLSEDIASLVRPGGMVILSGLLNRQEPQVKAAYAGRGLVLTERRRLSGWTTLVYRRVIGHDPVLSPSS
jgi:ribosomal protein L11 methyltransferase